MHVEDGINDLHGAIQKNNGERKDNRKVLNQFHAQWQYEIDSYLLATTK